jgi:hypothetical protein
MSAPVLDISPDALDRPHRLDLARLEAMMLWPTDPAARETWQCAAILEVGAYHLRDMPEELLRQWAADALFAPRIAQLMPHKRKAEIWGRFAGELVLAVLAERERGNEVKLGEVISAICRATKGKYQIEPQTVNNEVRPMFRSVVHLWAAYMRTADGTGPFPCEVDALPMFLATAEAIRERAHVCRIKHARNPLMKRGEAVLLPAEVSAKLPQIWLNFGS